MHKRIRTGFYSKLTPALEFSNATRKKLRVYLLNLLNKIWFTVNSAGMIITRKNEYYSLKQACKGIEASCDLCPFILVKRKPILFSFFLS